MLQAAGVFLLITIAAYIYVPLASFQDPDAVANVSTQLITALGIDSFAPPDSAFRNGSLVGPNGELGDFTPSGRPVCGGSLVDSLAFPALANGQVTACQSFNFQIGLGSLVFANAWGVTVLNGVTVPVTLMFLAFPFRM